MNITHNLDIEIPHLHEQFIGGDWAKAANPNIVPVISPATEEVLTETAMPTVMDADKAASMAHYAFYHGPWPRMAIDERAMAVEKICDAIEKKMDVLNRAWSFESGATISHGDILNNQVGKPVWRQMIEDAKNINWRENRSDAILMREPIGTVLSIMTFNGPIVLMGMKIVPALLAGCTVIAKHAPESPLTARLLAECVAEANLPEGVLSFIPGDVEITKHLVSHDCVDMVTLTGGTEHGVDVVKRTADRLARTTLELGGKSPAIVAEDADFEKVMETLVPGSCSFMGQICVTLSRLILPETRYDEMVEAIASRYNSVELGDPLLPDTEQGPLSVKRGRDRSIAYIESAKKDGAKVVCGGEVPSGYDKGWWFSPTLIADVNNQMKIAREEIFGPVAVAIPYKDIEDAVNIANDSPFGLAASIYTQDDDLGMDIASRMQSGTVAINMAGISFFQPFGGYKKSGWGKECGIEGILEFTQLKQVVKA